MASGSGDAGGVRIVFVDCYSVEPECEEIDRVPESTTVGELQKFLVTNHPSKAIGFGSIRLFDSSGRFLSDAYSSSQLKLLLIAEKNPWRTIYWASDLNCFQARFDYFVERDPVVKQVRAEAERQRVNGARAKLESKLAGFQNALQKVPWPNNWPTRFYASQRFYDGEDASHGTSWSVGFNPDTGTFTRHEHTDWDTGRRTSQDHQLCKGDYFLVPLTDMEKQSTESYLVVCFVKAKCQTSKPPPTWDDDAQFAAVIKPQEIEFRLSKNGLFDRKISDSGKLFPSLQ